MIMERPRLEFWSILDVKTWASDALGTDIADLFEKEEISGECLSEISVEELKEMGVQKMGKRLLVMKKLKTLMQDKQSNGHCDSGAEGVFSTPDSTPTSSPTNSPAQQNPTSPQASTSPGPANSPITSIRNSTCSPKLSSPKLSSPKLSSPKLSSPKLSSPKLSSPKLSSPKLPFVTPTTLLPSISQPISPLITNPIPISPSTTTPIPPSSAATPIPPSSAAPISTATQPSASSLTPPPATRTLGVTSAVPTPSMITPANRGTASLTSSASSVISPTVIRAPIAHIPSHLDLYHVPKRMKLSPPSFPPTMLHSTVAPPSQVHTSLEEALTKLNSYSDMARALSHQTLASSVRSLLAAESHQKTRPGQILKPIPQLSSVASHALTTASTAASTQLSPAASISPNLSDLMLDMKSPILEDVKNSMISEMGTLIAAGGVKSDLLKSNLLTKASSTPASRSAHSSDHNPPTVSVGDTVFQVNCRGKLTRESQERLKQVNPRLHSHYLTKRNLIKRACRTVFPDPPPFFYTDADRNSQEDLQILEQLAEKLAPVCCIPELCFSVQGIRNHIIDSCRERRRECKRQSYRPSKARPAGHLYNSDGTQITDPAGELAAMLKDDINDRPYSLSQDSADCIIRVLFNVESVYHVRRSVHLIPITKRLGLSQRVDKNWMIMAIAQALVNNGYISFNQGADLERLSPNDFVLEVPDELYVTTGEDSDMN